MIWRDRTILIIDDEPAMCRLVATVFEKQGAKAHTVFTGESGLREVQTLRPDLVILDILMPGMDGLEVCRRIREFSGVPILILTAVGRDDQVTRCLYAGADDYITKPFNQDVLKARAWAVLRRAEAWTFDQPQRGFDDDYLHIDLDERLVKAGGKRVELTNTEFAVLSFLYQNAGRICAVDELLQHLYGDEALGSPEEIRIYIWHLRQQMERDPSQPVYLAGDYDTGYIFKGKSS